MSRFSDEVDITYQNNGSNWFAGTQIVLTGGAMPQYPFEEYRVNDRVTYRNRNGDAYSYQNYNKVGYRLKWTYLDETTTNSIRRMIDANPYISVASNGTYFGTFFVDGTPSIRESQFEMYDIELNILET